MRCAGCLPLAFPPGLTRTSLVVPLAAERFLRLRDRGSVVGVLRVFGRGFLVPGNFGGVFCAEVLGTLRGACPVEVPVLVGWRRRGFWVMRLPAAGLRGGDARYRVIRGPDPEAGPAAGAAVPGLRLWRAACSKVRRRTGRASRSVLWLMRVGCFSFAIGCR